MHRKTVVYVQIWPNTGFSEFLQIFLSNTTIFGLKSSKLGFADRFPANI